MRKVPKRRNSAHSLLAFVTSHEQPARRLGVPLTSVHRHFRSTSWFEKLLWTGQIAMMKGEWSYFSAQPSSQPIQTGDSSPSSSSSQDAPPRRTRHRPPTPPFPPAAPLPSRTPAQFLPGGPENSNHPPKSQSRPKSDRQAYAQFLSRLQDEDRHQHAQRARSRSNSSGASALLRLLAHETARADAAEKELAKDNEAVIARVRNIREAQLRAEAELSRVTAELALYKLQLDIAQREILRAQAIVDDVERARAEAEGRAIKDRERIRKMVLQRATDVAREEGRREGWREGLERGRWDVRGTGQIDGDDVYYQEATIEESARRVRSPPARPQSSASVTRTPARERTRDPSSANRKRDSSVVHPPVPALPIAAPIPLRPSQRSARTKNSSGSPEDISIHQSRSQTRSPPHPSRSDARSPSLAPSRRSLRSHHSIPPDGYIPTLGPDAHISLPPPHELSVPVDFTAPVDGDTEALSHANERREGKGKGVDRAHKTEGRNEDVPVMHVHAHRSAPRTHSEPSSEYDDIFQVRRKDGRDTPALSTVSRGSTRISQYDIVSPPKARREERREERRGGVEPGGRDSITHNAPEEFRDRLRTRKLTPPEKIIEDWRSANSDIVGSPTPQPGGHGPTRRTTSATGDLTPLTRGEMRNAAEDPTALNAIPSSPRIRSPRISGGSREPMDSSQTIPQSSPQSSLRGSYIYRTGKEEYGRSQTQPTTQLLRPSSAANIYRQPTPSSTHLTPPTSQPRGTVQRSISNVTVPGIDVEPPSHSPTNSSEGTIIDPVLLTPEHANRPTALPDVYSHDQSLSFAEHAHEPIIVSQLPPGFVPLSPIPTMSNFKPEEHDHNILEQFRDPGYQIYAGAALIPETRIQYGSGLPSTSGSGSRLDSLLFREPPRPSTAAAGFSSPRQADDPRKRVSSFGDSPAALNRPFSIFSDD